MRPPESGPAWTGLSDEPLPIAAAHAFLADPLAGGTCVFVGTTRRWTGGVETPALDYEAYRAMAAPALASLAAEAAERWPVVRSVVFHRVGVVALTEPSVVVGVACAHRDAAFAACRWAIDTLKETVPIWKRDQDSHAL